MEEAIRLKQAVKRRRLSWHDGETGGNGYMDAMETTFAGFTVSLREGIPDDVHAEASAALTALLDAGVFARDVVWVTKPPRLVMTPVDRVLLGDPGVTYTYKGLRLFPIPWGAHGATSREEWLAESSLNIACDALRRLNDRLCAMAGGGDANGYNVCLINFLNPLEAGGGGREMRDEPYFGMGKLAVGWHHDDGLVPGSSISVYNFIPGGGSGGGWKVGLKVAWDVETDGVAVPMLDGDAYTMHPGFNEKCQHCVISGKEARFSTTHRVAAQENGHGDAVRRRAADAIEQGVLCLIAGITLEQVECVMQVHGELEFSWLRQYWWQGGRTGLRCAYWRELMRELEEAFWRLELISCEIVRECLGGGAGQKVMDSVVGRLGARMSMRKKWQGWYADAWESFGEGWPAVDRPEWGQDSRSSWDVTGDIEALLRRTVGVADG